MKDPEVSMPAAGENHVEVLKGRARGILGLKIPKMPRTLLMFENAFMSGYHQTNTRKREISTTTGHKSGPAVETIECEQSYGLSIAAIMRRCQVGMLEFPLISLRFPFDFVSALLCKIRNL